MISPFRRCIAIVATVAVCLGGAAVAGAAPVSFSTVPVSGWSTNGPVRAVLIVGDTVYAGGDFTQVRGPGGSPVVNRARLAAWDIRTGALRTGFAADANGRVDALASDGSRLFVGGDFTSIKGVSKTRLAAVDPVSGNVDTAWSANATAIVYGLRVAGTRLYAAGAFKKVGSSARNGIAAVARTTGAVDATFNPNANAAVHAVTTSPDGATVYLAGDFTTVGTSSRPYLAAVTSTTGAATPTTFQYPFADVTLHGMTGIDISESGAQVFGSLAGNENRVQAWDTATGKVQWNYTVMGDTQAVRYYNGNVYFGFHEGAIGDTTVRLLVADAATGQLVNTFRPPIDSFYGIWSIDVSALGLALGGEFTTVNGVATQGVAIMPPSTTDTIRPTAPGTPTVTGTTGSTVSLSWTPGADNVGIYGYRVLRNGVPVGYITTTTFTDTGLPGDTDVVYAVQTIDTSGNISDSSGSVLAHTTLALVTAGSTWKYLDNGTDQSTGWRAPTFDDSTWKSGLAELGYGDGDETTVVGFGPDAANKYVTTYFRRNFSVADASKIGGLTVNLLRDDGAVVYLNGTEVVRSNMPGGTILSSTLASAAVADAEENRWFSFSVNPALLVTGTNTLSVEIHQNARTSSDISFNLSLDAVRSQVNPPPSSLTVTGTTETTASLSWVAPTGTGATTEYRVYRNGTLVGSPTGTTFTDVGLTAATIYSYAVSAITNGTETATSASVLAATPDLTAPSSPTNLATSSVTGNSVSLIWNASTDNVGVVAYDVLRDTTVVGTTTTPGYTDGTVTAGLTYSYTVRARDAAGNTSVASAPLSVSTPAFVGTTYADTFDSGSFTLGRWTTAGASIVAGAVSGYFARLTANAGPAYLTLPATVLEQGHRSWTLRGYFRINSRATKQAVSLVELKNVAGKSLYAYTDGTTGRCTVRLAGLTVATSFRCDDGAWHLLEMKGDMGTTTHTLDWRVDGGAQPTLTATAQTASTVRNLYLGEPAGTPTDVQDWDNFALTLGDVDLPFLGGLTPFG